MIKRTVKEKGKERIEIVYGMTNLPRKKANAERLLELNRNHWAIENRLHHVVMSHLGKMLLNSCEGRS